MSKLTIVITGASRGLGAGMAEWFHGEGHRLGLCSRSDPILPNSPTVVAHKVDVTQSEAVDSFCDTVVGKLGPIDLWIGNAGILDPILPIRETSVSDFEASLRVNLTGVFNGTKTFIHHLRARGGKGTLVNISSGAALKGYASWGAYCAGKAAVDRLTECAAVEESASGLRAFSVAPGVIDTDMQEAIRACTPEQFPTVQKFLDLKKTESFNSPAFVAQHILALAQIPQPAKSPVVLRLPNEKS